MVTKYNDDKKHLVYVPQSCWWNTIGNRSMSKYIIWYNTLWETNVLVNITLCVSCVKYHWQWEVQHFVYTINYKRQDSEGQDTTLLSCISGTKVWEGTVPGILVYQTVGKYSMQIKKHQKITYKQILWQDINKSAKTYSFWYMFKNSEAS